MYSNGFWTADYARSPNASNTVVVSSISVPPDQRYDLRKALKQTPCIRKCGDFEEHMIYDYMRNSEI